MKRIIAALAIALAAGGSAPGAASSTATLGLIPAESPEITTALADGARLALEQAVGTDGPEIELIVASEATHWSTASAPAVELAFGSAVVALITPPNRATAHLVAQIGSRAHIPVLTTTRAPSIGATGSYWVVPLVELAEDADETAFEPAPVGEREPKTLAFESAFRARFGYQPDGWAALGYQAAAAVAGAVGAGDPDRYRIVQQLRADLALP